MSESIFVADGEHFLPTEQARGPWRPLTLHGGAPAALMTAAFERMEPGGELPIGRLGFEFLRPIPLAPLTLSTHVLRPGRRVQELAGELRAGDELIARASALRVQGVPSEAARAVAGEAAAAPRVVEEGERAHLRLPAPEAGRPFNFTLSGSSDSSFAGTAMEMRWLSDPRALGPGRVWMRMRHPLVHGQPLSSLARLAGTADFCNGVSASLPFERFLFINADLTIHLQRLPHGEWIGLDAVTLLHEGGGGLTEGVLHDEQGPVGRAFQTLVVQQR